MTDKEFEKLVRKIKDPNYREATSQEESTSKKTSDLSFNEKIQSE